MDVKQEGVDVSAGEVVEGGYCGAPLESSAVVTTSASPELEVPERVVTVKTTPVEAKAGCGCVYKVEPHLSVHAGHHTHTGTHVGVSRGSAAGKWCAFGIGALTGGGLAALLALLFLRRSENRSVERDREREARQRVAEWQADVAPAAAAAVDPINAFALPAPPEHYNSCNRCERRRLHAAKCSKRTTRRQHHRHAPHAPLHGGIATGSGSCDKPVVIDFHSDGQVDLHGCYKR